MTTNPPASIVLDDPNRKIDPSILDVPGAFVWWYVDTIDEHGNGMVFIWSFGLPFLPGLLSKAREGDPPCPRLHPALNVVWYRGGREAFYLLQTYDPDDAEWSGDDFRFGRSHIRITRQGGRHLVVANIDCDIPRSQHPLTGTIRLEGPAAQSTVDVVDRPAHAWTPLTGPAVLRAALRHGSERFEHIGRAYHDRNVGRLPLDRLGIDHWSWGRVVEPARTRAHYLVWDEPDTFGAAWLVEIDRFGNITHESVDVSDVHVESRYGVRRCAAFAMSTSGGSRLKRTEHAVVDEGPFYLRTMFEDEDGQVGLAEHVEPHRIDLGRHRPLVRMRVHNPSKPGSMWLPLFTGPERGRWARLLGFEAGARS